MDGGCFRRDGVGDGGAHARRWCAAGAAAATTRGLARAWRTGCGGTRGGTRARRRARPVRGRSTACSVAEKSGSTSPVFQHSALRLRSGEERAGEGAVRALYCSGL